MISRKEAEKIISRQDVRELALIAYRHAERTGEGATPEYGAAVLNLETGCVYGQQGWPYFHGDHGEDEEEGMGHEVLVMGAPSDYYADEKNPRPTRKQFVEEQVAGGLQWSPIRSHLDEIYGR